MNEATITLIMQALFCLEAQKHIILSEDRSPAAMREWDALDAHLQWVTAPMDAHTYEFLQSISPC